MPQAQSIRNAYRQSENQTSIHPVKLIYMMYERVISHLRLAEEGIGNDDAKLRGENLSRAIAIITELNASIKEDDESDAANFLRGLYIAILTELPKVSVSNDVETIRLSQKYLEKMKAIWQETAMEEAGLNGGSSGSNKLKSAEDDYIPIEIKSNKGEYKKSKTAVDLRGLSVAI